jgi:hypothetical protein
MKSIMEEASSLTKAIENAWNRAGKPQSFSIKIFQDAEKNFFGMTTKKAKIALFFAEGQEFLKQDKNLHPKKGVRSTAVTPQPKIARQQHKRFEQVKEQKISTIWTEEMIVLIKQWVSTYLQLQGLPNITFSTIPAGHHLTLHFESPLVTDRSKEHSLFSSLAHLLLTSLKQKLKSELRGLRITISQA